MHVATFAQQLLAATILFIAPTVGTYFDRRLKRYTSTRKRICWYRANVAFGSLFTLAAVVLARPVDLFVLPHRLDVASWLGAHTVVFLGAIALAAAYFSLAIGQGLRAAVDPALRARIGKAMRSLQFALPVSASERRWWILVSISAGVCEEILYRGFLTHYFSGTLVAGFHFGAVGAWLVCALAFGLAHAYQGIAGVVRTTAAGLVLGLIAILCGSLLPCIVLHILADLQVLWMYRPLEDDPESAARLMQGCAPAIP
jgi:membrane protease YdiL (CAAX protease family)